MRNILAGAMVTTMALALLSGTVLYAAVRPDVGAPMFGLVLLAGLLWCGKLLLGGGTWKPSPMHWPVALFFLYAVLRYFTSPFEHDARVELFQVGICALAYFIAATQFYRPMDRAVVLGAVVLLVLFESAYGLWQTTSRSDMVLGWVRPDGYRSRAGGTFVCPNNLAAFLEMSLGLLLGYGLLAHLNRGSIDRSLILRLVVIYAAAMAVVGIIATFSRAGWGATLLGMLVFAFWGQSGSKLPWSRLAGIGVVAALMALAAWKVTPVRDYVRHTLAPDDRPKDERAILRDPSFGGRVQMWKGTLKLIAAQPVFGAGLGSWQWAYQQYKHRSIQTHPEHAHNDILHAAADYGLVGFALLCWLFFAFYRQAATLRHPGLPSEQRAFAIGSVVGVTALLAHSWFDFPLHIPANSLLLALLLGCVAAMDGTSPRHARRPMASLPCRGLAIAILLLVAVGAWFYLPTARAVHYSEEGNIAKFRFVLYPEVALGLYAKAIAADPKHPEPHAKTGDIYRRQAAWLLAPEKAGERRQFLEQALTAYDSAIRLNSLNTDVLVRQGATFEMLGRNDQALTNYLRAVAIAPVNAYNHHRLARYYLNQGDETNAYVHFEKAHLLNSAGDSSSQINMHSLRAPEGYPAEPRDETNGLRFRVP